MSLFPAQECEETSFGLRRGDHQEFVLFLQPGGEFKELGVLGVCFFQLGFQFCVLCFEECHYFCGGVIIGHLTHHLTGSDD